ncbi:hypothetical protein KDD17_10170 [Sulfitobacter albidus]|uniref:Uncharacterized protein n=1 Tax=Sulfitobacter albidus TaxID=2829501 RepID=A0A975JBS2_9RHOB|nr:hypothetical protein [Sulfitobacter albidus]QUJ75356.1 hypothetical protein KDD17_10170 [Sulfitobacter albidus]
MSRSANEVMTLAAKAARGSGAPPAQAADFGQAAVLHLAAGRAETDLLQAMGLLPGGPIMAFPLELQKLSERARDGIARGEVDALGLPDLLKSYAEAMACAATFAQGTLTVDLGTPQPRRAVTRMTPSEALLDDWAVLAARLLVPETESSRARGAGAGLTDND